LEQDDVKSTSMGAGGEDVQLSPRARELFNYALECKSKAAFIGYGYYDQARSHAKGTKRIPLVVVKANHRNPLVILDLDNFLELL
jgi:hypothetical protein